MLREKPENHPVRLPFTIVLASITGLWLCYFLLTTLRAEMLGMQGVEDMYARRLLTTAFGIIITIGLWSILRLFDTKPLWAKITAALVLALPAALLSAQVNRVVFADMQAAMEEKLFQEFVQRQGIDQAQDDDGLLSNLSQIFRSSSWEQVTDLTFSRYFMLLAWCSLYLALLTGEKARAAERREGDYRRAAKAAELRSLRYQVNPHFLFNTLNSLSALVLTGKTEAAEKMIQTISTFYRRSLANDPTSDLPLLEEIALQQLYLEIEAVRFPERLRAAYVIPEGVERALVPGMILQPLVENSVKHAVAPTGGQITITIAAREEYGRLVVTVSDNGSGAADSDDHTRPGYGIGIANVRDRLQARFGEEASIISGRVPGGGYATHLRMPILRDRKAAAA